jgi:hypothetical protein
MTVEIEHFLRQEDIRLLLETAEASGSIRRTDLNELVELHQLDVLETDLLYSELERRGIETVENVEKE